MDSSRLTIKGVLIFVISGVLLLLLSLINSVATERLERYEQTRVEIAKLWGGSAQIRGPVFVLPIKTKPGFADVERNLIVVPSELVLDTHLKHEDRYRGIFNANVYGGVAKFSGAFDMEKATKLLPKNAVPDWAASRFAVFLSGKKVLAGDAELKIGGLVFDMHANNGVLGHVEAGLVATGLAKNSGQMSFTLEIPVQGTSQISFMPMAMRSKVAIESDWHSPSFFGSNLPNARQISATGFTAKWHNDLSTGRASWIGKGDHTFPQTREPFGVKFVTPVSHYQKVIRATKHGILIVVITFAVFLLFDILASTNFHPMQYLLVGTSLVIFYLLLLSFSEHLIFYGAYLVSAGAVCMLVGGYIKAILKSVAKAGMITAMIGAMYGILYVTLSAEKFALLSGSLSLFFLLALFMYTTRNIDWSALGKTKSLPPWISESS